MLYGLRGKLRYLTGLWRYLRVTITSEEARDNIMRSLARREENFLRLADLGIYGKADSPFRRLLLHAGIELEDLRRLVGELGIEAMLQRLYDAGVYVTYDEMRGRVPVRRGDLEFTITEAAMDNPLLEAQYEMGSSGSSGSAGSRAFADLNVLAHDASYYCVQFQAHGVANRRIVQWGPVPPALIGLTACLRYGRWNMPISWISHTHLPSGMAGVRGQALILYTFVVALLAGRRLPLPKYIGVDEPMVMVRYLQEMMRKGTSMVVQMTSSGATRVCDAAHQSGIDLADLVFRVGGEPFTPARAAVVASAGARAFTGYQASELGVAGLGCAAPGAAPDDLHLVTDKFFVYARDKVIDNAGSTVPALVFTTIHPSVRKIMLNAETGDYGTLEDRDCGCLLSEVGFKTHLTGLHGYDKMTSEGVTFMGSDLYKLVEEVLPARFGGSPTDYQLAETEDEKGLPKVSIVVAPSVGAIDEQELVKVTLEFLGGTDGPSRGPGMTETWRQGQTLRVERREPFAAGGRKVLPLHLMSAARNGSAPEADEAASKPD